MFFKETTIVENDDISSERMTFHMVPAAITHYNTLTICVQSDNSAVYSQAVIFMHFAERPRLDIKMSLEDSLKWVNQNSPFQSSASVETSLKM